MNLDLTLRAEIQKAITALFNQSVEQVQVQPTNVEFEGSHTLVCFPLTKLSKKSPEETGKMIGEYLQTNSGLVTKYNVVKGFLNLSISDAVWAQVFESIYSNSSFGQLPPNGKEMMVEYSSPNTNKPLHLGHLRNNFLGYSVAEIYKALGYKIHKVQIINDRGIHICKSMAAWQLFGNGETPESSGLKGDKLVGKYYVEFDKHFKAQIAELESKGLTKEEAEKQAPIMQKAVGLLLQWEANDSATVGLWKTMNGWVYKGFDSTYKRMGVDFDKLYYESQTYLLGKDEVLRGVEQGVFYKKEDGSVWVDLTGDGLDQKVLLRSDGTSVYMTQDIGTAILRFRDFPKIEGQVYTVGNEQEYHFKVLFLILKKLGYAWAEKCYHLSYGMVDLPTGKMKSREGTVVDADDLMQEMVDEAEKQTRELGKIDEMGEEEIKNLSEMVGLGALKFFLLKVDPKKRMMFDPSESIQLQGHTGPFIQYTHARVKSILRKADSLGVKVVTSDLKDINSLEPSEREIIFTLNNFHNKLHEASREYSPSVIANYAYDLAKEYNQFYQAIPIFNEADQAKLKFRIAFSSVVADVIKRSMTLLGIQVPERM
ncbi:MAG: arginine--tRNA ligase [Cytophagales bacterium]|jgi:arginyl-tRNA synthetase|nr:arginine--tRNA ligase [Cytophagales bacterium]MCA6387011.1 arginine--tRNA ligase [Cytophagales bacterium]MCA6392051.1 arginine--tRNA ligase [Cytophagales bacterium]MCA6393669.1 arginine--tRNA ligase [Cytophagales bacterium]MCA6399426.1 arginine--tRNA ligase [Cytophagales bacterium]